MKPYWVEKITEEYPYDRLLHSQKIDLSQCQLLHRYSREGKINLDDRCEVIKTNWDREKWQVECSNGNIDKYDRIWLATGTKLDIAQDPLFTDILSVYRPRIIR
jgi:hypothetical protein